MPEGPTPGPSNREPPWKAIQDTTIGNVWRPGRGLGRVGTRRRVIPKVPTPSLALGEVLTIAAVQKDYVMVARAVGDPLWWRTDPEPGAPVLELGGLLHIVGTDPGAILVERWADGTPIQAADRCPYRYWLHISDAPVIPRTGGGGFRDDGRPP
jgi:hypothetical protein